MKVLVTFALAEEFAPWRAMRKFEPQKWAQADAFVAQIGNAEVGVLLTGVGTRQSGFEFPGEDWAGPDALGICISSGLVGALRPEYQIGQVLAARTVSAGTVDYVSTVQFDQPDWTLESSAPLLSFAEELGATVASRFYTSGRVIARAEEKKHLAHSADAVEMESFGILSAAANDGIPAIAIRAVSDVAGEGLPLDMTGVFNDQGRVSVPRVLGQVAMHPTAIPGLVKLGKQSKAAAESLARFLDQYVGIVAERMTALESKAQAARG
jgi:adenosylhomocysteine nucleosidase